MTAPYKFGQLVGKVVRAAKPRWADGWRDFMQVIVSPSMPGWQYQPTMADGPFRLVRYETYDHEAVYDYFEAPDLDTVIARMVRVDLPHYDNTCVVLDDNQQIVIGWQMYDNGSIAWCGCATAFEVLARHHWPAEVAAWEAAAKVASTGGNDTTEGQWTTKS